VSGVVAIFPGTFDPVTNGHVDLVERAAALYDRVVVSVSAEGRKTWLPVEERVALLRAVVASRQNVTVESFRGLVVEQARKHGARVLVRGLRGERDLEHEMPMAFANRQMAPALETVFLPASPATRLVSSSLVREVAALGGDVSAWVPEPVARALRGRKPL
jgi:pantetheine-phosphate adenylyltransferase